MIQHYNTCTLKNGLRVVHMPSSSNVAHCGIIVGAGTRDEKPHEFGMAHFVEHMLFKGTVKRSPYHIINRMEAVGGELNAYTNKEETVIYSTFLEQDINRAVELISDLVLNSQYLQNEIDKEIEVIIDEIHSYDDLPSESIHDDFEDIIFRNTEIGHNILGTENHLRSFTTNMAKDFVCRYYRPSNMVFFCYGKTNFSKLSNLVNKYFSNTTCDEFVASRMLTVQNTPLVKRLDKNTSQAHVLIGGVSYNIHDEKRRTLSLLNNILGGPGMNSRLNVSLREKKGLVYHIESTITAYSDTGLNTIYFGTDKKNIDKCISLVYRELKKIREIELTTNQLHAAKKQYIGQIGINSNHTENMALALGKNFMYFNHFDSLAEISKKVDSITAKDLIEVANQILAENNLSSLIYN